MCIKLIPFSYPIEIKYGQLFLESLLYVLAVLMPFCHLLE